MTTLTARQKLISYLADAEDSKVNALFALLEKEMQSDDINSFSDDPFEMLEIERTLHITGKSKSYSRREAADIIRGKGNNATSNLCNQ